MAAIIILGIFLAPIIALPVVGAVEETANMATIQGEVNDADGVKLPNVKVIAEGTTNKSLSYEKITDINGNFDLNVQPGEYLIHAEKAGGVGSVYYHIEVKDGDNKTLHITLQEHPSSIGGVVSFNGAPLSDVSVRVSDDSDQSWVATSSRDGKYTISNIPSGRYTIEFSKKGYETKERSLELLPMGYTNLDVEMERSRLPVSNGFIPGYDLAHSFMIIGLGLAITTLVVALLIQHWVRKRPEQLSEDEEELEA